MFKNKVAKGVALMDRELPGWEKKIDLELLDLGDSCSCIIGQAYSGESYIASVHDLFEGSPFTENTTDEYGFSTPDCNDYPSLTREWKELILERRKQKNV
jgi:hypothetical protein